MTCKIDSLPTRASLTCRKFNILNACELYGAHNDRVAGSCLGFMPSGDKYCALGRGCYNNLVPLELIIRMRSFMEIQ